MASRKITDLAITLQPLALEFITRCKNHGIDALIICTYRSDQEQAALYAQGRTTPGEIVTNAAPGQSAHNISINGKPAALAFDAVPVVNGKPQWQTTGKQGAAWLQMGIIAAELGLKWGGNFKGKLKDCPHFQLK